MFDCGRRFCRSQKSNADSPVGERIGIIAKLAVARMRHPDSINCQ